MQKIRAFMIVSLLFGATTVLPGSVHDDDLVVGIMAGIPNDLSVAEQNARLRDYKQAGVRFIRSGIAPNDQGIEIAKRLYDQGIKIDWMVLFQYRPDAPTRAWQPKEFPNMWAGHPLSALDPDRFRNYFQENLDKLEANGVHLASFEVGNEINWAAFNAEFPVPGEGKGVLGLDDLYDDPEGQRIARGYLQYLKILGVLKDVRDHSRLNRQTPILSAGLVDAEGGDIPSSRRVEAVSFSATLDFMRANGLDKLVDGYGVHVYPNSNPRTPAAQRWSALDQRSFVQECRPPGSAIGKPCWITEWGIQNADTSCPPREDDRVQVIAQVRSVFRQYAQQGRIGGLFYFTWAAGARQPDPFSVNRCGALTDAGKLALSPM